MVSLVFCINVRHCGGLFMVLLQLKDPLEIFLKRIEFLPGSGFLSCRDIRPKKINCLFPVTV